MQELRVGQGYTASWTITLRNERGQAVVDTYTGDEELELVISDLAGGAIELAGSTVAWGGFLDDGSEVSGSEAAALALVKLTLDNSDTSEINGRPRGLSITITIDGEPYECYRALLRVESRPVA